MPDEIVTEQPEKLPRQKKAIDLEYTNLAAQLGHNLCQIKILHSQIKSMHQANQVIQQNMLTVMQEKPLDEANPE